MQKSIVFEDVTAASSRWIEGPGYSSQSTTPTSLGKLLGISGETDQYPNNVKKSKSLHPLLVSVPASVGDALLSLTNIRLSLNNALQSNLVRSEKDKDKLLRARRQITAAINHLKFAARIIGEI